MVLDAEEVARDPPLHKVLPSDLVFDLGKAQHLWWQCSNVAEYCGTLEHNVFWNPLCSFSVGPVIAM